MLFSQTGGYLGVLTFFEQNATALFIRELFIVILLLESYSMYKASADRGFSMQEHHLQVA